MDNYLQPQQQKQEQQQQKEEHEEKGESMGSQIITQSPSPLRNKTPATAALLGKVRKTRNSSRMAQRGTGILSLDPSLHRKPIVRMTKMETTNLRLAIVGKEEGRKDAAVPAPTPYEEELQPQVTEEDVKLGPSYYSAATCSRTGGISWSVPVATANRSQEMKDPDSDVTVRMETDSLDGNLEVDVTDEEYQTSEEKEPKKRTVGRPANNPENVGKYVGIRWRREEEAARKKEAEKERLAREALSSDAPTGMRWRKLLEDEEEKEEELQHAPTENIAAQLQEHSAILFKTADCSKGTKGVLVRRMKETVTLMRAATTILARRAREAPGANEMHALRRDLEALRAENRRLRQEVEGLKTASAAIPASTTSTRIARRAKASKRQRMEESEDSDAQSKALNTKSVSQFPSLPHPSREEEEKRKEKEKVWESLVMATMGLSIEGKAREIDPVPV